MHLGAKKNRIETFLLVSNQAKLSHRFVSSLPRQGEITHSPQVMFFRKSVPPAGGEATMKVLIQKQLQNHIKKKKKPCWIVGHCNAASTTQCQTR